MRNLDRRGVPVFVTPLTYQFFPLVNVGVAAHRFDGDVVLVQRLEVDRDIDRYIEPGASVFLHGDGP